MFWAASFVLGRNSLEKSTERVIQAREYKLQQAFKTLQNQESMVKERAVA